MSLYHSPRLNYGVRCDPHADPNKRSLAHMDVTAERGTRGDVNEVLKHAIVVYYARTVQNAVIAYDGIGLHYDTGHDDRAYADMGCV